LVEQERLVLQRTRDEAVKRLEQIESRTSRPRLRGRQRTHELGREAQELTTAVRVASERLEELERRASRVRSRAAQQATTQSATRTQSVVPSESLGLGL
jgi:hypothetical protein